MSDDTILNMHKNIPRQQGVHPYLTETWTQTLVIKVT